ncbi:MAG: redoxin domain-containing protein [Dokdonella sp.]|uniref:redoxin domain-containing protein n=1 Tax=Dokdonella sp. TaxID=2291710 RepID=UPI0025B9374D|nr:redoxin domain-containing protein [Dokdonella sp.]MBZ0222679.1 redoxin domain-containing protein [Dokdonella sp.]MCC7256250.1 redoxin domain-containing protein [Dokdonella sp.]
MKLAAPNPAPRMYLKDIDGKTIVIGKASGRRTLLCFFRDAACPFCNFRIYELTAKYGALQRLGLDVVAIFQSDVGAIRRFVAKQPRPFPVIADPRGLAYETYGIERSLWGKLKAIVTRIPTLLKGLRLVGLAGLNTNNVMPADFLIDTEGRIVETWYARDAGDHIPFERIELFVARDLIERSAAA